MTARPSEFARSLAQRLSLRQLRLVVALGEAGSVRRAAESLHMSQPGATRSLAELELSLGVELFRRARSGVVATEYGELLMRHARQVEGTLAHAEREMASLRAGESGVVRLGTIMSGAVEVVPAAIIETKKRFPTARILIDQAGQDVLFPALRQGTLDLAVARLQTTHSEEEFEILELVRESFCVACSTSSRWLKRRHLELGDLLGEPWVFPTVDGPLRRSIEQRFLESAGSLPANTVDSISLQTNLALVREGGYLCVMPRHLAEHYARLERVRILNLEPWTFMGPVAAFLRRSAVHSQPVRYLVEALRNAARGMTK